MEKEGDDSNINEEEEETDDPEATEGVRVTAEFKGVCKEVPEEEEEDPGAYKASSEEFRACSRKEDFGEDNGKESNIPDEILGSGDLVRGYEEEGLGKESEESIMNEEWDGEG